MVSNKITTKASNGECLIPVNVCTIIICKIIRFIKLCDTTLHIMNDLYDIHV